MEKEFRFEGILNGLNLDVIDNSLISTLIEKDIYRIVKTPEINFSRLIDKSNEHFNSIELGDIIYFNNETYSLNNEIREEIYHSIQMLVDSHDDEISEAVDTIILNLEGLLTNEEKVKYLKDTHKKYWELLRDKEYLKYIGQNSFSIMLRDLYFINYNEYENDVKDYFSSTPYIIKQHLSDKIQYPNYEEAKDVFISWRNHKKLYAIDCFCKDKFSDLSSKERKKPYSNILNLKQCLKDGVYEKLIEKLKAKEIIDNDHKLLTLGYGYTQLRILSAIGYSLAEMKFFKEKISAKDLCKLLSKEFHLELSPASYSAAKKTFQDYPNDANYDLVRFIKEF